MWTQKSDYYILYGNILVFIEPTLPTFYWNENIKVIF